ncbi:MAG TPA: glycosyltransferase family 39 protein [Gemmatimonadaceae bacterium]|nr:glycosyltransferase family 39 protein [Gemmatimonadaceae bacterium]
MLSPLSRLGLYESAPVIMLAVIAVTAWPRLVIDCPADARAVVCAARAALRRDSPWHWIALGFIVCIAAAVRVLHLGQPMRYDEAWTYTYYASQPLPIALSDYTFPNNHIFHRVLVWIAVRLFGNSPPVIRLPAFVAGVLMVPAAYLVARRLAGKEAGLIAAALTAAMPSLILYSTNARGYSLLGLCFLTLLLLGSAINAARRASFCLAFSVVLALGMFTVPVTLYAGGAVVVWLLLDAPRGARRKIAGTLAAAVGVAALFTLIAYGPVIVRFGIGALYGNRFVTALTWPDFIQALPAFAYALPSMWFDGVPTWLAAAIIPGIAISLTKSGGGRAAGVVIATVIWCGLLLVAMRRPPFPRVWLFMVPVAILAASDGLAWLAARASRLSLIPPGSAATVGALLIAGALSVHTVGARVVFKSGETGTLADGEAVARFLREHAHPSSDHVVVMAPTGPPIDYYLATAGGVRLSEYARPSSAARVIVIVNEGNGQALDVVMGRRRDIQWSRFSAPRLLQQFPRASVYEVRAE